jgi:hypothetical protein
MSGGEPEQDVRRGHVVCAGGQPVRLAMLMDRLALLP